MSNDIQGRLRKMANNYITNDLSCGHIKLLRDAATEIDHLLGVARQVDELYSHAWDRADGGLSMFGSSVPKFEDAHKAVREALGIKLLTEDAE